MQRILLKDYLILGTTAMGSNDSEEHRSLRLIWQAFRSPPPDGNFRLLIGLQYALSHSTFCLRRMPQIIS